MPSFTQVEDGQVQATVDELPGLVTAGCSHQEAKSMLVDALHFYLVAVGELQGRTDQQHDGQSQPLRITVSI
jgi:predicted RNase H-like HicB family nuclease